MHELSIVLSIVDLAAHQVKKNQGQYVEQIELEIGELAGVAWDALEFAWEAATKQTVLANCQKEITRVQGKAKCLECTLEFRAETLFTSCPRCGSYFSEFIQGKELRIKSLTIY